MRRNHCHDWILVLDAGNDDEGGFFAGCFMGEWVGVFLDEYLMG